MIRHSQISLALGAALLIVGCDGGGLTPNQKAQANKQWNDARAGVLSSLAADQYKDGSFDKCQESLNQAMRLEPADPKLHLLQARLSIEQGKLEIAELHLAVAGQLDPKNAEVDYLTGIVLQRWQQPEKARASYGDAVRKDPSELSYLLAEAEMFVAQNKPSDALELLESKGNEFEHSSVIRDEIGQLLIQQNKFTEGIAALREGCLLATDDLTIREHLAFALLANRQYAESADSLEELLRDPTSQKRADIQAALGDCRSQTGQYAEALKCYDSATQLNPCCSGYWLGLSRVTMQLGDFARAQQAAQKAITVEPASGGARTLLGYARLKQNQLQESLAAFKIASDLNPRDGTSLCMQGYVLERLGRKAEAQPFYAKAIELDPQDVLARRLAGRSLDR